MRLIDADALKKTLNFVYSCAYIESKSKEGIASDIIDEIDNAPTVPQVTVFAETASKEEIEDFKQELENVLEKPQGKWIADINHCYSDDEDTFECSVCKEPFTLTYGTPKDNLYNFCPNCGADMRKGGAE